MSITTSLTTYIPHNLFKWDNVWTGSNTFSGSVILSTFTEGSVLFVGASGVVSQNNSQLFWNNTNGTLTVTASASQSGIIVQGDLDGGTGLVNPIVWKTRDGTKTLGSLGGYLSEGMFSLTGDSTDGATGGQIGEWTVLDRNRTHFGSDKRVCSLQVRNIGMNNDDSTPYDLNISQAGYPRAIIIDLTNQRTAFNLDSTLPINTVDISGRCAIGASYAGVSTAPTNGLIVQGNVGIATASPVGTLDINYGLAAIGPTTYGGSASAVEDFGSPQNYVSGDEVNYRIYEIYTVHGQSYYSSDYAETGILSFLAPNSAADISWTNTGNSNISGYLIVRDYNGSGFDITGGGAYYYFPGQVNSLADGNFATFSWSFGVLTLDTTADGHTIAGYFDGDVTTYGLYTDGIGYFGQNVGIGQIAPQTKLHVKQTDNTVPNAAIFQGYSDGGTGSQSIIEIRNSASSKMMGFGTANLAGAGDYGNLNFFGTATSSYDGYAFGDFNWLNNSGELTGDLRVGTMRVYRSGAANQSTFQLLCRSSSGFTYQIVSTYEGKTGLSGISAPSARLHLPAGSTTAGTAPIKLTTGSYTTSAVAGQIEWDNATAENLTWSPSTTRYRIPLINSGALTSGRVPFATTNGRLTDDSDFTFATDTLTITKIAATTFTGDITLSTKNIITDTTTGTVIATATTQKLGFFNATPVVQQAAATDLGVVLSNLGFRASGTAYPITTSGAVTLGSLTSGRVPFASTAGLLADDSTFTFSSSAPKRLTIPNLTMTPAAESSGNPVGCLYTGASHTNLTASAEVIDINFNLARTVQRATGAVATQRAYVIQNPTYSFVGASTISDAATLAIVDAPVAGTNATITRPYALWVQAGKSRFGDAITVAGAPSASAMIGLAGNTLAGVNQIAFYTGSYVSTSAATTSVRGFSADISSASSSFVMTFASAFLGGITAGTSSTITNAIMFDAASGFAGTITNQAVLADNRSFVGSFFLHQSGTVASVLNGALKLSTAGAGLFIKEGTNATMGSVALVLGTATVSTTKVTASSRIFLSSEALGTVTVATPVAVTARTAGTSFVITSSSAVDTSTIAWVIIEPA